MRALINRGNARPRIAFYKESRSRLEGMHAEEMVDAPAEICSDGQLSHHLQRQPDIKACPQKARKGDEALIRGKQLVNFATAEQYLGIGERWRQKLMRSGDLKVEGLGQKRKITTESLRARIKLRSKRGF